MSQKAVFHGHDAPNPMSQKEATERLEKLNLYSLQEIARADGLPVHDQRGYQIQTILLHWYPPNQNVPEGENVSFRELIEREEQIPIGERRVWRKKTWGKEMGF
jgi:hypothetical protein